MPTIPSSAPNCRRAKTASRRALRRLAAARVDRAVLHDPQAGGADLYAGDYVSDRIMSPRRPSALTPRGRDARNILVAGGTSSGKTTLANALLAEVAKRDERVIMIEDTRELQCAAPDCVALRTKAGRA